MKKNIGHIPLIIISTLMAYCIYTVMISNVVFSYEHYIGLSAVVFSIAALFFKQVISKAVTVIVLILGTFSLAAFTAIIEYHRIGFSFGDFGVDIKVQYYCLFLLLLFIFLNLDFIKQIFRRKP
jgi:hypothetical protein